MKQYSEGNQEWLLEQNKDVTDVRGFHAWKKEGRRVKKGEKALQVFAPIGRKIDGPELEKKELAEMTETEKRMRYRKINVFDISQTETEEEYAARKEAAAA